MILEYREIRGLNIKSLLIDVDLGVVVIASKPNLSANDS